MFMCVNICFGCLERFILNYTKFIYGSDEMGGLEKYVVQVLKAHTTICGAHAYIRMVYNKLPLVYIDSNIII
jgi:hypothetical protein